MEFVKREPVDYGWSGDKKYHAWDAHGKEYFLRVCPLEKEEQMRKAQELQQGAWDLGLPVSQPLGLERREDGVYVWEQWLPGQLLNDALPALPQDKQRSLGLDAGKILKQLHSFPAPEGVEDWEQLFNKKIDRKIRQYRECPLQYENGEAFIQYLEENRQCLVGRPQCRQHGDYHVGNMMLWDGKLTVIDFDRFDWGDPWEEFNRIVWCAQAAPAFASGMVGGYFGGEPPLEFWKLLALYIASNTLGSLPWSIPYGEGEIRVAKQQAAEVLGWYDNMKCFVPHWYQPAKEH